VRQILRHAAVVADELREALMVAAKARQRVAVLRAADVADDQRVRLHRVVVQRQRVVQLHDELGPGRDAVVRHSRPLPEKDFIG
jgi:hypothetical protein